MFGKGSRRFTVLVYLSLYISSGYFIIRGTWKEKLLELAIYNHGIVDYARMETFAKEPRYAKLLRVNVHSHLSSG